MDEPTEVITDERLLHHQVGEVVRVQSESGHLEAKGEQTHHGRDEEGAPLGLINAVPSILQELFDRYL
jgi:hypothetical protein